MSDTHHVSTDRLEELVGSWSDEAQEASDNGNMEYSLGLSTAADELREVIADG